MFTRLNTKLDKAIALSVLAMIGFNVVVMTQQLNTAPSFVLTHSAPAQQA